MIGICEKFSLINVKTKKIPSISVFPFAAIRSMCRWFSPADFISWFLLMIQNPLYILAFLCLLIAASEWLCRKTVLKHLSSSLVVIILGAIFANFGLIPSASNASPVYDGIFKYVAPLSIFFLLLGVSLKKLKQAGLPMLLMFFVGASGTMVGVLIALQLVSVEEIFGDSYKAIAGMMTGTYMEAALTLMR